MMKIKKNKVLGFIPGVFYSNSRMITPVEHKGLPVGGAVGASGETQLTEPSGTPYEPLT